MGLVDKARNRLAKSHLLLDLARLHDRPVEIGLLERIAEPVFELAEHIGARMERHRSPDRRRHGSKLVEAVTVITVGMGDDHAVEAADVGAQQLLAKVGPAIDQHALTRACHQDRGAQAGIARLIGVALAPFVADLGDSGRRPAAENSDFHAALY